MHNTETLLVKLESLQDGLIEAEGLEGDELRILLGALVFEISETIDYATMVARGVQK